MKQFRPLSALAALLTAAALIIGCSSRVAVTGDTVRVHYTGTLSDGSEFDSSRGREPLRFTLGAGQMIPGFEKAVLGMRVGETKTVTIPAEEAYGPRRDDLVTEMERDQLPLGTEVAVGRQIIVSFKGGRNRLATITEVTGTTVTLDANHPLAGEDLTFEIELVKIE